MAKLRELAPAPKTKKKKVADYAFDERNINKGSTHGMKLLGKSIEEVGFARSTVVDKNGKIIAGNKTMQRAAELGHEDVIEIESDGSKLIVIRRTDLDIDSTKGKKAKILDNTVSAHNYVEDVEAATVICEEAEIYNVKEYGLKVPEMEDPEEPGTRKVEFNVSTKPVIKIEFDSFEDLESAKDDIKSMLEDNFPGAKMTVKSKANGKG